MVRNNTASRVVASMPIVHSEARLRATRISRVSPAVSNTRWLLMVPPRLVGGPGCYDQPGPLGSQTAGVGLQQLAGVDGSSGGLAQLGGQLSDDAHRLLHASLTTGSGDAGQGAAGLVGDLLALPAELGYLTQTTGDLGQRGAKLIDPHGSTSS